MLETHIMMSSLILRPDLILVLCLVLTLILCLSSLMDPTTAHMILVVEGCTRSGHHLLELLLLFVPEAVLLVVIALIAGVVPVVVVVLAGVVKLLPLGAVSDEVSGVTTLEAAPRRPPPLLAEPVQGSELSRQQSDLIVEDAIILLIRSCTQGRQSKLQSR
jgi:hypothetical protein